MNGRKLEYNQCIRSLSKKNDLRIDIDNKIITMINPKFRSNSVGNKSFGMIDFLRKRHDFHFIME